MATQTIQTATSVREPVNTSINLLKKFDAFADAQQEWAMMWWIASLMIIGSLFLPVTFLIVYSFNGPVMPLLALSMISFFASIIANMGSMGIKASIVTFLFSLVLHLAIILSVVTAFYLQ